MFSMFPNILTISSSFCSHHPPQSVPFDEGADFFHDVLDAHSTQLTLK